MVSFSFIFAFSIQASFGAILPYITLPFGFENKDGAQFGGAFIIVGVIGSTIFSKILDRTARFKELYILL